MAQMKMKNEEILQRVNYLTVLSQSYPQKGKLGYAIAVNGRKMAEAVQEYSKIKNETVNGLKEEVDWKDDDSEKVKAEKQEEINDRIGEELKDIAWIEQDVDIMQITDEELYNSELNSMQMSALLWMVKEDE